MSARPPLSAIRIRPDGASMCALLGPDLHEGEAEFEPVAAPYGTEEQRAAGELAACRLEARLGIAHLHLPRIYEDEDCSTRGSDWWKG